MSTLNQTNQVDPWLLGFSPGRLVPVSGIYRAMPENGPSFSVTSLKDDKFPAMDDGSGVSYRLIHEAPDARQHELLKKQSDADV